MTIDPGNELAVAQAAVARAQSSAESVGKHLQDFDQVTTQDRSLIVKIVIGVYSGVVALFVAYLLYVGLVRGTDIGAALSDLIKVAILPIVTLVIGYYFGSSRTG